MNRLRLLSLLIIMLSVVFISCNKEEIVYVTMKSPVKANFKVKHLKISEKDSLTLVDLYDAMNGDEWFKPHNWRSNRPVEEWDGVITDFINGELRVVGLRMVHWNMRGEIPAVIKNLTALKVLDFGYNDNIEGSIPEEVYQLKNLEVLKLKFTKITGELSPSIGNLEKLDTLDLWTRQYENQCTDGTIDKNLPLVEYKYKMSGNIPSEIGKLKNLRYLVLGRQNFTGSLPKEMGKMTNLNYLDIAHCDLSGNIPAELGDLQNLETLFADYNQFTGSIPAKLFSSPRLAYIYLNNNKLTGEIPTEIGDLATLRHFSVHHNALSGSLPMSILKNSKLGILYLNDNKLSGTIPQGLGDKHFYLIVADLSNNNFTGTMPSLSGHATSLGELRYTTFIVRNNKLSGALPANYLRWKDLSRENLLPQQSGYGFSNLK